MGMLVGEPPMNMVDGFLARSSGKTTFKAGNTFEIELSNEKADLAGKNVSSDSKDQFVRLGIRCEFIKVSDKKISSNSFQLPVYAVAHEAESSIATFELENSFLHARISKGKGYDTCHTSEMVWLDFDQENIRFFEKTSELSKA